jgi:hypothetical protein
MYFGGRVQNCTISAPFLHHFLILAGAVLLRGAGQDGSTVLRATGAWNIFMTQGRGAHSATTGPARGHQTTRISQNGKRAGGMAKLYRFFTVSLPFYASFMLFLPVKFLAEEAGIRTLARWLCITWIRLAGTSGSRTRLQTPRPDPLFVARGFEIEYQGHCGQE